MKYLHLIFLLTVLIWVAGAIYNYRSTPIITVLTPTPTPTPLKPPDLALIPIRLRSAITNASIKQITGNGILFQCDQGLVQVSLDDLPIGFRAYYGNLVREKAYGRVIYTRSEKPATYSNDSAFNDRSGSFNNNSGVDRAIQVAERKLSLEKAINYHKSIIDGYSNQSSFKKNHGRLISSDEYELSKLQFYELKAEYERLGN